MTILLGSILQFILEISGRETASKRLTCLDITASAERICAMPFDREVRDSESHFNTLVVSGGHS